MSLHVCIICTTVSFTCSVIESPYPSDNIRCPSARASRLRKSRDQGNKIDGANGHFSIVIIDTANHSDTNVGHSKCPHAGHFDKVGRLIGEDRERKCCCLSKVGHKTRVYRRIFDVSLITAVSRILDGSAR